MHTTESRGAVDVAKKALVLLVIGFAIFYLLTAPEGAADSVKGAFTAVLDGFEQVMRFFNRLVS